MGALLRLLWFVAKKNPGGLYSVLARAAAAGVLGKYVQASYQYLAGKKTRIGLVMGCAYFAASVLCSSEVTMGCNLVSWIGDASVLMLSWGVLDASARADPPKEPA